MKTHLIILFLFLASFSYGQQKTTTNETYDLVILNGRVMDPETMFDDVANVVKNNEVLPVKAGQEIRFPIEAKGRFTPIVQEKWLNEHTIGLNPDLLEMHLHDDSGAGKMLNKEH